MRLIRPTCLLFLAAAAVAADPAPRLVCDQPLFDYGEVDNTQTVRHAFVLRNDGDAPLNLLQVRTGCGCALAQLATNRIPPGGQTTLSAQLTLQGRFGPRRSSIYVKSDDPLQPYCQLQFSGRARATLEVDPPLVAFALPVDGSVTQRVSLISRLPQPLHVTALRQTPAALDIALVTNLPGRAYTLALRVAVPPPAADLRDGLLELATDHPLHPRVRIPFTINRWADLVAVPRELCFAPGAAAPQSRLLVIRSAARRPFAIRALRSNVPDLAMAVQRAGDFWQTLRVGPLPPDTDLEEAWLRIETDLEQAGTLEIPLRFAAPPAVP